MRSLILKKQKIRQKKLFLFIFVSVSVVFTYWFSLNIEKPKSIPITVVKTKVHGNDDDNCRMHIVYEIYAIDVSDSKRILKYGISSQCDFLTKDGNPRPEYQIPKFQLYEEYKNSKVWYKILHRNIPDRKLAKKIEQDLINKYYLQYEEMPP